MKLNKLALASLILLVPSLTANIKYSINPQVGDKVIKIIDGDTFKLENNQTIRLASINSPELGRCYSSEATKALSDLILGKRVSLLEPYASADGRIIALVISNGQIINELMVRNGYAVDTYDNFSAKKALQSANDYARKYNLGVYSEQCSQVVPPNLGCIIKGNHHQADNSKIYTYPGCTNYNRTIVGLFEGDRWFCTESEAINAGYIKSGDCQSAFGKF